MSMIDWPNSALNPNRVQKVTHDDCWVGEPCAEGAPASCPHEKVRLARAELRKGFWSPLVVKKEPGGLRHYLDGQPVHCGAAIEVQATADKTDDYGGFTVPLQEGLIVRYEASQDGTKIDTALFLYTKGVEFVTQLQPWMRFRWPKKAWQR